MPHATHSLSVSRDLRDDRIIAQAIERNFFLGLETFSVLKGASLEVGAGYKKLCCPAQAHCLFNGVFATSLDSSEVNTQVASIKSFFLERSLPSLWWLGPSSRPLTLAETLQQQGWALASASPGMALRLADVPRSPPPAERVGGYDIRKVRTPEGLGDWTLPYQDVYALPDDAVQGICESFLSFGLHSHSALTHLVGYKGGKPVVSISVFFLGGVAGLFNLATLPEVRGQGFATSLIWAAIEHARARGFEWVTLISSKAGVSLYTRIGFKTYCNLQAYYLALDDVLGGEKAS